MRTVISFPSRRSLHQDDYCTFVRLQFVFIDHSLSRLLFMSRVVCLFPQLHIQHETERSMHHLIKLPYCQIKAAARTDFTGEYGLPLPEKNRKIFWQRLSRKTALPETHVGKALFLSSAI